MSFTYLIYTYGRVSCIDTMCTYVENMQSVIGHNWF